MNRAAQNVKEQTSGESGLDLDANQSQTNMDKEDGEFVAGRAPPTPPPAKGWMIGPLFQSFKSKMASFVMSPVKLFKPNDAPPSSTLQDFPTQLESDPVLHSEHAECQETFILNSQLGEMDGNNGECSKTDGELRIHQSRGLDEDSAGDVSKILDFREEQNRSMSLAMTEKETNNNTTVPVLYMPVHRSLVTSSFEQSPGSTQCSPSSLLSNTSASCGSKLNPNIEIDGQMGSTVTQQRPLQRKRVGHNKTKSNKSSSPGGLSSEISSNCATVSSLSRTDVSTAAGKSEPNAEQLAVKYTQVKLCRSGDNDASSTLSSTGYYTLPASLCLADDNGERDGGVNENNGISVCSSRPPIRKTSRKAATVNKTALKEVASSDALQKQLDESEENQDIVVSTRRKKSLKATSLLVVERNSEKNKRGSKRQEKLGEAEEKGTVIYAGLESSTLPLVEHKVPMEPVGQKTPRKQPTRSDHSAIMETEAVQEPVHTSGRKGRGKQNAVQATSGAIGLSDRVTVNQSNGGLFEGNDPRGIGKRSKISNSKDPEDCLSSVKRVRKKGDACSKPSKSDYNLVGDMELETTMTTTSVVEASLEEQVSGDLAQHLDTKALPKIFKIQKKGPSKQKRSQNRQKSLVGDDGSMTCGPCPKRSVELIKHVDPGEMLSNQNKIVDELMQEEHGGECTGVFGTSVVKASLEGQVPGGLVQHLDTKELPRTSKKKRKATEEGPSQNRRRTMRFVQPDPSLVGDEGRMTLPSGACLEHEFNQEKVFSNYGQNKIVDELMEEENEKECTGVFGTSVVKASLEEQVPGGLVQHFDATEIPRTPKIKKERAPKRKVDMKPPPNRQRSQRRSTQPDPSLVEDGGSMTSPSGACPGHSVAVKEDGVDGEVFSNYDQNTIVKEAMEEEHGEKCAGVFGSNKPAEMRHRTKESRKKLMVAKSTKRRKILSKVKEGEEEEENEKLDEPLDLGGTGGESSDGSTLTGHLQRSYSCPEMPILRHHDSPWNTSLLSSRPGRTHASHRRHSSFVTPDADAHPPKSFRRARRHTVCSVEVEREIAPSCLWKEVYPTRRPSPYRGEANHLSPSVALSPSTFLAQVSCFLSSPLAFLSKKIDKRGVAAPGGAGNYVTSPGVLPSSSSPSCSSLGHPSPRLAPCSILLFNISSASVTSPCSPLSHVPLEGESGMRPQSENGEDTSCSWSQEFESMVMTEEKASSDSEIKKRSSKHEERGKVSSIRIRRALPKAQNNLTPMGLPRVVRKNKKEFSLEEIYTNKNFTKPPESRLETIFEVPRNRRDGAVSLTGQSRMKRYVVFPEVGVARKPRKPLVGAGKSGNTAASGRRRRGLDPSSEDVAPLSSEQLDSLLCSKLEQLAHWFAHEQETC